MHSDLSRGPVKTLPVLALSALLSILAFSSCFLFEEEKVTATIQIAGHLPGSEDSGTMVVLMIRTGAPAFCLGDSGSSPGNQGQETDIVVTLFMFDTAFADWEALGAGTWTGVTANSSREGFYLDHRADLRITSLGATTVKGDYTLRDDEGAVTHKRRSFDAQRCPDFESSE